MNSDEYRLVVAKHVRTRLLDDTWLESASQMEALSSELAEAADELYWGDRKVEHNLAAYQTLILSKIIEAMAWMARLHEPSS